MQVKWTIRILVFMSVIIAGVACTGLASEPEIVSTLPVRPTSLPPVPATFDNRVSLEQGALVFAENCVRCHGISGAGDGELALSGDVQNVPDFTDPLKTQDLSFQEFFDTITNGRLDALMPPWKDKLSVEDRWAVALYVYTLSYNTTTVTLGQDIYDTQCADCHALDGGGSDNGISLLGLVSFTEANLQDALVTHATDLDLPSATDEGSSAVVKYLRLLSSESRALPDPDILISAPQPVSTEEVVESEPQATSVAIPEVTGILRGSIIQGTDGGGASVEGLEAVLHIYDSQLREQIAEYIVGADGTYQYDDVVIRSDFAYRMTVDYKGVVYSSGVLIGDPNEAEIVLDVTVYEAGADESALEITARATQINLSAQGLYIIEVIDMVNRSDRAYIRDDVDNVSESVSVGFALPETAELQLDHTDPDRIILSDDGRTVLDIAPVLPNSEHYVQYSYLLPIENAQDILQPIDYQVSGSIAFFVENSHLDFVGDGIDLIETRPFNNQEYNLYEVSQTPTVGQTLSYDVTLRDSSLVSATDAQTISREALALVLLIAGLVFVGGAGFIIWRSRKPMVNPELSEDITATTIMQQIAELDNQFEMGKIEKVAYNKQRNQLKSHLLQVMKTQEAE
jgi:mono/diheme cytochrome c family protein